MLRSIERQVVRDRALRHAAEKFHYVNCETYSFLYLGIAEALGLPLRGVAAPEHVFVRWTFPDGRYLNWETTNGLALVDGYYKRELGISDMEVRKGMYLATLSDNAFWGVVYEARASAWRDRRQYGKAVADSTRAIQLNPVLPGPYLNRGVAYEYLGQYDQAIGDYDMAISLKPNFAKAYHNRGNAYLAKREYNVAIWNFSWAIKNYGSRIKHRRYLAGSYHQRAVAYYEKGEYQKARDDVSFAKQLGCKVDPRLLDGLRDAPADAEKVRPKLSNSPGTGGLEGQQGPGTSNCRRYDL